ncbi:MAG: hypothetical protein EBU08_13470 [Micrococcales bacterium]|nr:hypothetical protein [Micrococcales bacterium]
MSVKRNRRSEWVIALERVLIQVVDDVPGGWKTREQIAKEMGVSPNQASKCITKLKRAGAVEIAKYKIKSSGKHGIIRRIDHYRLVKSNLGKLSR